jgi:hypothetical protein
LIIATSKKWNKLLRIRKITTEQNSYHHKLAKYF